MFFPVPVCLIILCIFCMLRGELASHGTEVFPKLLNKCSLSSEVSDNFYILNSIDEMHRGSHHGYKQEEGQAVWCSVKLTAFIYVRTSCSKGLLSCIVLLYLAYVKQFTDAYELFYFPHSLFRFLG